MNHLDQIDLELYEIIAQQREFDHQRIEAHQRLAVWNHPDRPSR